MLAILTCIICQLVEHGSILYTCRHAEDITQSLYIYIYIYLVLEELSTVQVFTLFVGLTMNPSAAMELS